MNKQIEEMAHLICERDAEDICTLDRKRCDMKCTSGDIAKHLYSHGYRKQRKGRWIICSDGYYPYCSECKNEPKNGNMTDFCPHCGAKMNESEGADDD